MEFTKSLAHRNPQTLEMVQRQFADWRETRKRGQRIPRELWEAACLLFPRYSIHQISQELNLDYQGLKGKLQAASNAEKESPFVELAMRNTPMPQRSEVDCRMKMRDSQGGLIKIKVIKTEAGRFFELLSGIMGL